MQDILAHLNTVLHNELTAINQYFLHAKVLKHRGAMALADHAYRTSIEEMRHVDQLVERILELGGMPAMGGKAAVEVKGNEADIVRTDLQLKESALHDLNAALACCREKRDEVTSTLLERIATGEREHQEYLKNALAQFPTSGVAKQKESTYAA